MNTPKTVSLASLTALLAAASAVSAAINTSDITSYAGTFALGQQGIGQASDFGSTQLLSGGGLALSGAYADADVDEDDDRRYEADLETTSISLGYVHAFDGFNLGVAISAVNNEFDADGTDLNPNVRLETEGDGWIVSVGASKQWEKLELVALAGAGELSYDNTRVNGSFNEKNSDYDSSLFFFSVKALYEVYQSDSLEIRPFLELGYVSIENDGFTESNSPDFVTLDDYEDQTPYAELGLNLQYVGFEAFHPYLNLSVWQDLGDDEVEIDGTDSVASPTSFEVPDVAQTVFNAELGFAFAVTDNLDLGANVGFFTGDELSGYSAGLSAVFSF